MSKTLKTKFATELIASLKQAVAHAKGRKVRGLRVTTVASRGAQASKSRRAQ